MLYTFYFIAAFDRQQNPQIFWARRLAADVVLTQSYSFSFPGENFIS